MRTLYSIKVVHRSYNLKPLLVPELLNFSTGHMNETKDRVRGRQKSLSSRAVHNGMKNGLNYNTIIIASRE